MLFVTYFSDGAWIVIVALSPFRLPGVHTALPLLALNRSRAWQAFTEYRVATRAGAQITEVAFRALVAIIALPLEGRIVDDLTFLAIVVGAGISIIQIKRCALKALASLAEVTFRAGVWVFNARKPIRLIWIGARGLSSIPAAYILGAVFVIATLF